MPTERRPYRREPEASRRDALVAAALDLVGEGGVEAATVRAIALRAGVTPGLIRHYFTTKDDLIHAAYRSHMDAMTSRAMQAATAAAADPARRLAAFVVETLEPPSASATAVRKWAALLLGAMADAALQQVHVTSYLGFRDALERLIADLPQRPAAADPRSADPRPAAPRRAAIACNAVLDGLWLEASVVPDQFAPGEIVEIGLASVGAVLGLDLPDPRKEAEE